MKDKEKPDAFPAIAAWVTSYGRVFMDQLRALAGAENVYYQGTDSLYVADEGLWRLAAANTLGETELGRLKALGSYNHCEFRGPGDYILDGEIKRAGHKANAIDNGPDNWTQRNFERLGSVIAHKPRPGIAEYEEDCESSYTFNHGIIGEDSWVKPYRWGDSSLPVTLADCEGLS